MAKERKRCFTRKGTMGWATFSPCERYRYILYRKSLAEVRDPSAKAGTRTGVCIMLNPSTADEDQNDPTIRRTMSFLADAGCADAYLLNLFGYRATKPVDLAAQDDPVGPHWDRYFDQAIELAGPDALIICAWGSFHLIGDRGVNTRAKLERKGLVPHGLRLNGDGNPAHPLYLPKALTPTPLDAL